MRTPFEAELEAAVRRQRTLKEGAPVHLRAEHFKQWLREAYPEENLKNSP